MYSKVLFFSLLLMSCFHLSAQTLEEQARTKIEELNALINVAQIRGVDVLKEQMTVRTAEVFLDYANWDETNLEMNSQLFAMVNRYKDNPDEMAELLPDFERNDVILMLDEAISALTMLNEGAIFRKVTPNIDWENVTHDEDQLTFLGRPVFLADFTWKPDTEELTEFYGNQDGYFLTPNVVTDNIGTIRTNTTSELNQKETGAMGFIFFNHKNVPQWSKDAYGDDFEMRTDTFTGYDIDNPGAKEMQSFLLGGTVPKMAGNKYSNLGYMLCNEPHFFTQKTGDKLAWASGPVSNFTDEKFKIWLEEKHTSINQLNNVWGSNFLSFDQVTIEIPIDTSLRGSAKWYDWSLFNMHRVTEWYKFLKAEIEKFDDEAKVHLKIMPNLWTNNKRVHGIDLEALTHMSEIIGNDAGAINNHMWGPEEEWEANYSFEWRELCMGYDFMKSVSPDKITYNTEVHFLSTVKSRDLYLDPAYARATYWLAHIYAMTASQTWFWPRTEDGSPRNGLNVGNGYAGSNNQQPRVTNEVMSTMMDLNSHSEEIMALQRLKKPIRIFYSKTSAINKETHMDELFELYEELHFEGTPIGFVTQDILSNQNSDQWEVVLVADTEFATEAEVQALQTYLDNGGRILVDTESLQKNEYGETLTKLTQSNGTLTTMASHSAMKTQAFSILESNNETPRITVAETNTVNHKGCVWRSYTNDLGNVVVSIVNVGKSDANLNIELKDAVGSVIAKDLINGVAVTLTPVLKPYEVYFVEISDVGKDLSLSDFYGFESADAVTPGEIEPNPNGNSAITGWFFRHQNYSFSESQKFSGSYSLKYDSAVGEQTSYQAQGGGTSSPNASKLNLEPGNYTIKLAVYIEKNAPNNIQTNIASPFKLISWDLSNLEKNQWHLLSQEVVLAKTEDSKLSFKILDNTIENYPSVIYFDDLSFSSNTLSIDNVVSEEIFKVYPNPVLHEVFVKSPKGSEVVITDIHGTSIKQLHTAEEIEVISTKEFDPGIYFIRISNKEQRKVKKMIKK